MPRGSDARVVAALAIVLSACALPAPIHVAPRPPLRLATYNLNYGLAGDPSTMRALVEIDADVVVLQEASPEWLAVLATRLDDRWPYACHASSERPAGAGAILSRYPLRDCAVSESAVGWFPAVAATLDAPLGAVRVIDVHLQPARSGVEVIADLAVLPGRHGREIRAHVERLVDPSLPTILAGDFNESDGEGALRELETLGFASALAQHAPAATTWRWPLGTMQLEKRLDHVMYRPRGLRCVSARVVHAGRSDHYPVIAQFTLPMVERPYGASLGYRSSRR